MSDDDELTASACFASDEHPATIRVDVELPAGVDVDDGALETIAVAVDRPE